MTTKIEELKGAWEAALAAANAVYDAAADEAAWEADYGVSCGDWYAVDAAYIAADAARDAYHAELKTQEENNT
jgi:hypothetical protein